MREEIKRELPLVLQSHICSITKASKDPTNRQVMCESDLEVVDFDKIPNEYARGKGWSSVPKSNDALYVDSDRKWHFIEFKNGNVNKEDIYRKMYDSIIMLMEMGIISDFNFVRKNVEYTLVYNPSKYPKNQSESRERNTNYLLERAKKEKCLFEVEKFRDYLFYDVHTYSSDIFQEKFIVRMEQQEQM